MQIVPLNLSLSVSPEAAFHLVILYLISICIWVDTHVIRPFQLPSDPLTGIFAFIKGSFLVGWLAFLTFCVLWCALWLALGHVHILISVIQIGACDTLVTLSQLFHAPCLTVGPVVIERDRLVKMGSSVDEELGCWEAEESAASGNILWCSLYPESLYD